MDWKVFNQSGFMTGRCIVENTRLIYDLMHYTYTNNIPGLLMLTDFQKAFDSVFWTFLQASLKFFGFKESFCNWIKVLNSNVRAAVLQCGRLSDVFYSWSRLQARGSNSSLSILTLCRNNVFIDKK